MMTSNGRRTNIPPWIMNPELIAPCMCGQPFDPEVPYTLQEEFDTGLKRWWHKPCWLYWTYKDDDDFPGQDQDPLL